jgi:Uma2 family endonuclease
MSVAEREPRRWTVDEYFHAAETGVFGPEERLELIEGEILAVSPQNSPHATSCELVVEALRAAFGIGVSIRDQKPLVLEPGSAPEPDVYVTRGSIRDYARRHPTTALLVVEVADSTLRFDLGPKARLYAAAGIPEYWVVNLVDRVLVVHRQPDAATGSYASVGGFGPGTEVLPVAARGARVLVDDLLP